MDRISIIKETLTELDKHGIRYCILRNYNFLLERRTALSRAEKSIDLVIPKGDYAAFHTVLVEQGFTRRKKLSYSHKHVPYFRFQGVEAISFDVQIGGVHWNDMCYLDEKYLIGNKVQKSFFYVPSDNDTFVMLLAHSILGKRYFKPEYQERVSFLAQNVDKEYVTGRLAEIFSKKQAGRLYALAKEGKFKEIVEKKHSLIALFIGKSARRLATFLLLLPRYVKHEKKIGTPTPLISIIGPDGAGKSTVVKALAEHLRDNNKRVFVAYTGRGRNHLLPMGRIGRAYKGKERKKDRIVKPTSSAKMYRKVLYTLAAPVFTLDLLLRYVLIMLPKRRAKHIIITDRYGTDIFLMEHVPLLLRKFLLRLFPKPTITFYLYNSPEILHQRRPEESIPGLERQLRLFAQLESYLKPIKIKTDDEEVTSQRVIQEVMAHLFHNWF